MIFGATGAVAVVIVSLAQKEGVEYVFATVILAGILQTAFGLLRLEKIYSPRAANCDVWFCKWSYYSYFSFASTSI